MTHANPGAADDARSSSADPTPKPEYLTVAEATELSRVSQPTMHRWLHRGLRSHKVGRRRLIRRDELIAFIEGGQAAE